MQLNTIPQERILPRINREFVGIGRQLEKKRKSRRKIEQQQRIVENRVLHLEKQQLKAQKDLIYKRKQLQQLLNVKERQQEESRQKQRLREERQEELERLKKQSQYMRMLHKHNLSNSIQHLRSINHNDYSRIKNQKIDGEYRKKKNHEEDLKFKQEIWKSSNFQKEIGKSRIDEFHRQKNRQHLIEYNSRILKEEKKMHTKMDSMKELQEKQMMLKEKLEQSTMKNSKVAELINHISKTTSTGNSRIAETIDYNMLDSLRKRQQSRKTVNSERKSASIRMKSRQDEEIQENIQYLGQEDKRELFKIFKKRRKNKHVNRYKQYEAY